MIMGEAFFGLQHIPGFPFIFDQSFWCLRRCADYHAMGERGITYEPCS